MVFYSRTVGLDEWAFLLLFLFVFFQTELLELRRWMGRRSCSDHQGKNNNYKLASWQWVVKSSLPFHSSFSAVLLFYSHHQATSLCWRKVFYVNKWSYVLWAFFHLNTHHNFPPPFFPSSLMESDMSVCRLPYQAHYGSGNLILAIKHSKQECVCVCCQRCSKKNDQTVMLLKPADVQIDLSSRKFQLYHWISKIQDFSARSKTADGSLWCFWHGDVFSHSNENTNGFP